MKSPVTVPSITKASKYCYYNVLQLIFILHIYANRNSLSKRQILMA